ncbi:hypothetical protein MKW98_019330 [Papaver atlanticum]|uniref:Amine oxidase domain-containing protein n=1 Tax=Papaver atlanticum TaxID=357466 RepID=A0AAD4S955_9MAGN|nr:hypothetical protein MKW98_019330 [Papaver atlanticum]
MVSVLLIVLVTFFCLYGLPESMAAREPTLTVIVVGDGFSAKTLSDAGITNILILEGTDRIGGRIKKTKFTGESVEVGANWVEGVNGNEVNPIWTMVNKIGLKTYYSDYDHLPANTYKQTGGVFEKSTAQKAYDLADEVSEFSKKLSVSLTSERKEDISILASQRLKSHVPSTPIEMAIDYYTYDYEFAEPPRVTSLQNTELLSTFANFGEDLYFITDPRGYETVVHYVAKQFLTTNKDGHITDPRLKLNKAVTETQYTSRGVVVKTEDGSVYNSDYVMISTSVSVLQTNLINFVPDLLILAIYQFDMSVYTKIFLKFPHKFWPTGNDTEFFIYAHEKRGYYTIWQQLENEYPGANCLLVTVTDDESRRIEQQPDSETKAEIMEVLRNMFGKNIPDATDILVPKWWSDRFYKGTFSNWPIGVTRLSTIRLGYVIHAPVGRVYFIGEHTSEHYNGYVHGAYLAGIDSANILINYAKKKIFTYNIKPKGT